MVINALGKDISNPLIVDSLLKTIWLSIHLVVYNEELAIPEQTTTAESEDKEFQVYKVIKELKFIKEQIKELNTASISVSTGSRVSTVSSKFVDQHNMVAYLEKSDENAEFHEIVDFLSTCLINYALTAVVISESTVRNDLLFDDEDGITCLINDEIFENLALMGYGKRYSLKEKNKAKNDKTEHESEKSAKSQVKDSQVKASQSQPPGYSNGMSIEKQTRNPNCIKVGSPYPF
ncbi:hypothetical protein Tco_1076603 [Tanacetum coccineum]